jgi:hypothetical protein
MNPDTVRLRALAACALLALGIGASLPAHAGRTAIDFGFNSNNGQNFPFTAAGSSDCNAGSTVAASCMVNLAGGQSSVAINLGFSITAGSQQNVSSLFINENGTVSFGAGITGFTPVSSLSSLVTGAVTGVIAPFYADLTSNPTAVSGPTDTSNIQGSILYARGTADIVGPYPDSVSAATTPAFYAAWMGPTLPDSTPVYTQLLLYSLGGGAFDLAIRYGQNDTDSYAAGLGLAGYDFGTAGTSASIAGDLAASNTYFYTFGSSGTGGGGTTVPEPPALALLSLGLLLAWTARRGAVARGASA